MILGRQRKEYYEKIKSFISSISYVYYGNGSKHSYLC